MALQPDARSAPAPAGSPGSIQSAAPRHSVEYAQTAAAAPVRAPLQRRRSPYSSSGLLYVFLFCRGWFRIDAGFEPQVCVEGVIRDAQLTTRAALVVLTPLQHQARIPA